MHSKNLYILVGLVVLVVDGIYGASIPRSRRDETQALAVEEPAVLDTEVKTAENLKLQPEVLQVDEVKTPEVAEVKTPELVAARNVDSPVEAVAVPKPDEVQANVPVQEKLLEIEEKSLPAANSEYVDAIKLVSTEDRVAGVQKVVENVKETLKNVPLSDAMKENAPILESGNEIIANEMKLLADKEKLLGKDVIYILL